MAELKFEKPDNKVFHKLEVVFADLLTVSSIWTLIFFPVAFSINGSPRKYAADIIQPTPGINANAPNAKSVLFLYVKPLCLTSSNEIAIPTQAILRPSASTVKPLTIVCSPSLMIL